MCWPVAVRASPTAAVRLHRPDLMLVDAYLPDGDGIAFVRDTDVDAFVLSAATDAPTIRRALRAGARGYLMKPFETPVGVAQIVPSAMRAEMLPSLAAT